MKITKFGHACLLIEEGHQKLIIDPGKFTTLPDDLGGIDAVIITEEHYDHFDLPNLQRILTQNHQVKIFSTQTVVDTLTKENISAQPVSGLQTHQVEGFTISFYETDHAPVYQHSPCRSLSIKINNTLYYPSDTYQTIPDEVTVLALPTSGPWYKVEESVDFMNAIKSRIILVTHNALNSEDGHKVTHHFLQTNLHNPEREFVFLHPTESIEI